MSTARAPSTAGEAQEKRKSISGDAQEHRLRSLTIRLDEDTFTKLIATAGEKSKAEYIRAVLIEHLSAPQEIRKRSSGEAQEHQESTAEAPPGILDAKVKSLEELVTSKDQIIKKLDEDKDFLKDQVMELDRLLHQEQVITMQTQKLIPAQEIKKKKWWHFLK
ncbi:MAG: hypothetical protein WC556_13075 [Candidatus Methanoperedens sp.]